MYKIEVHKRICQITKLFYRLGLWHRGDEATVKEMRLKWFYTLYILLLPISLMVGAFISDNKEESIFSVQMSILNVVVSVKLFYIIWRKKAILELLNRICIYCLEDHTEFAPVNGKQNKFMKYATIFLCCSIFTITNADLIVPFLGDEKKLFANIGFPLDYKHNEIAFWSAYFFIFTESILVAISLLFSVIMWYLMANCSLKYEVLGHKIKKIVVIREVEKTGKQAKQRKLSDIEKHDLFLSDLIASIKSHKDINESTSQMGSFLSYVLLVQVATSSLCICVSIYTLVYNLTENYVEYIMQLGIMSYNIFDVFMVMYFGNEIKLSSDHLSYCLFQSDWSDQPEFTKKCIIIFGERLKQAHVLVVAKLYTLTLETFIRIIKSAYSMFNILQNLNTHYF